MMTKNFAAIDFETANGSRASVCSVGVVVVREGRVVERAYSLIKPTPNYYSRWTTQIHGLSSVDTDDAPLFPEVWRSLERVVEGLPLVAHNSSFDRGCLQNALLHYGISGGEYEFFCTLRMARRAMPELPNHRLNTVAQRVGYVLRNHHHALADAEACAEIALKLWEYR